MEGKRLNLDAPLISIRRITASEAPARQWEAPLPYKWDLQSGQVGNSGTVPFVWERTPGQPKNNSIDGTLTGAAVDRNTASPKLPPGRILTVKVVDLIKEASLPSKSDTVRTETPIDCSLDGGTEKAVMEEVKLNPAECSDEEDAFSDARDTLSRTESFSMGCSASGLSSRAGAGDASKYLSKDPQIKEFMMGRFLPAAQAMASGSLQRTWWKPPRAPAADIKNYEGKTLWRKHLPLHHQYQLSVAPLQANCQREEEEEEEDCGNYQGTCGLLPGFCLKSSFCLSNLIPGMKVRDRSPTRPCSRTSPHTKISHPEGSFEDSWEAVYRYRLRLVDCVKKENGSKLTSESNQLTNWSDSQTLDDSSSLLHSSGVSQSPNKNDVKMKSRSSKSGSFDSCEKDNVSYWEIVSSNDRLQGSGSASPAIDRTFFMDSSHLPDALNSDSSLVDMTAGTKETVNSSLNGCSLLSGHKITGENVVSEVSEGYPLQSKYSSVADQGSSSCSGRLKYEEIKGNDFISSQSNSKVLDLKVDVQEKNDNSLVLSLLPPPLPKSPSDSWLQRTLPSIYAKGTYQQSLLGIQFHPRNKTLQAPRSDHKLVLQERSSKMHPRRTRFAGGPNPPCESVKSGGQSLKP